MILDIENPKESIKKLLELVNDFSKGVCKVTLWKAVAFLYANVGASEKEIQKTVSVILDQKQ